MHQLPELCEGEIKRKHVCLKKTKRPRSVVNEIATRAADNMGLDILPNRVALLGAVRYERDSNKMIVTHLQTLGVEAGSAEPAAVTWFEVLAEMEGFTARASAAPAIAEVVVSLDLEVEDVALVELELASSAVMMV